MSGPPPRPDDFTLKERFSNWIEDLSVRWFMLDAQAKQALILAGVYAAYTVFDVLGALAKRRIEGGGNAGDK